MPYFFQYDFPMPLHVLFTNVKALMQASDGLRT